MQHNTGARTRLYWAVAVAVAGAFVGTSCYGAAIGSNATAPTWASMQAGFEVPPEGAKARVWWHWMNGNVTATGIRKDLAWMHQSYIGGANVVQASIGTPVVVKHPAVYLSPLWAKDFRLAAMVAGKYDMEFGTDSSPGWSETGGPWVKPSDAMKKLVWSKTVIAGGKPFHGLLPEPPSNTGPFQDAPMSSNLFKPSKFSKLKLYRDVAVVAYRLPVSPALPVSATSNSGQVNAGALHDLSSGSLVGGPTLRADSSGKATLELRYAAPVTVQGITLSVSTSGATANDGVLALVETSLDGRNWRPVGPIRMGVGFDGADWDIGNQLRVGVLANTDHFPQTTVAFTPVSARYVRVTLSAAPTPVMPAAPGDPSAPGSITIAELMQKMHEKSLSNASGSGLSFKVHEVLLHSEATVNRFAAKADFVSSRNYYALDTNAPVAPGSAIDPKDVLNITNDMEPDGELNWTPPPGQWVVLRFGYSLEGTTNHPAAVSATGLEVDKLNRADVKSYMDHYLSLYRSVTALFGTRGGLDEITNDSTEVGMQNWTNGMIRKFQELRGYSPIQWLPVLTGAVVGSRAQSNRFLWDFRDVINTLLAKNHYEQIADIESANHITGYTEALESDVSGIGNDMQMRQYTDGPMGAMWAYGSRQHPYPVYLADLRGAESDADIYGKKYVAAESMTSANQPWAYAPRELKPIIDREFTLGVNRVFVHESAAQPLDKPPGQSLWNFGQMFNRLDVWANYARPWGLYMARCSYLLQQGHHVASVAYFFGQGAPIDWLFYNKRVNVPHGYGYDFVDAGALEHQLSVQDGRLVTPSGMSFRLLYLGGSSRYMTLNVLKQIDRLVHAGATVVGARPIASPSLTDNQAAFQALAKSLFGNGKDTTERRVGKGVVVPMESLSGALHQLGVEPDFTYSRPHANTELRYIHRRLADGGFYFISNRVDHQEDVTASFRVTGMVPSLWNAVTGKVTPASYRRAGRRTEVPLDLPAYGSVFVVFRRPDGKPAATSRNVPVSHPRVLVRLHGPWTVEFQSGRGAPSQIRMPHLTLWNESSLPGIRYFSGIGTYTKTFQLNSPARDGKVFLNLGQVWELAKVSVNGKPAGIVWTPPFRLNITKYVHSGENTLSVSVANLWVNRLIGDAQPGVTKKYTFTDIPTYKASAPLRASGLVGPVTIDAVAK